MQQTSAPIDAPRVHIITDSASDLVQGELEGIRAVVPLSIAFGDEEYLDGVDLSHHRFYEKLVESDELPRTSQITPFTFSQVIEGVLGAPDAGGSDEAVVITLSAKLSGMHESALAAAQAWGGRVQDRKSVV